MILYYIITDNYIYKLSQFLFSDEKNKKHNKIRLLET